MPHAEVCSSCALWPGHVQPTPNCPLDATIFTSDSVSLAELLGALEGAGFSVSSGASVRRAVLDTFDGRLARAGLRLEVRQQDGHELILSGGGSTPARVTTSRVPRLADDLPAGPLRARLAEVLDVRALRPVLTLADRQATATKRDRAGKARVWLTVHDRVVVDGAEPIPGLHVQVEGVAGYPSERAQAEKLVRSWGLKPSSGDLVAVAARHAGVALGGLSISPTVPLRWDEPALDAFRRVLANLASTVEATWPGTVDDVDPEFLHDLRVAVRRTRSVLSQGKRVLPPSVRRMHAQGFRWLGTATGRLRDLDVYLLEWDDYLAPLDADAAAALAPVRDHLAGERRAAHVTLARALRSSRYRTLMGGWQQWLQEAPSPAEEDAGRPVGAVVSARTAHAQDVLLARGRAIDPSSPAEDLHELRKDAKRLRYLLECFGSLYPTSERKAFVQLLKALQENLGEHQDNEVHVSELRAMPTLLSDRPGVEPATLVAIGQLTEQLDRRRRAARDDFADRFSAYDTKDTRRTFQKLVRSASRRR